VSFVNSFYWTAALEEDLANCQPRETQYWKGMGSMGFRVGCSSGSLWFACSRHWWPRQHPKWKHSFKWGRL